VISKAPKAPTGVKPVAKLVPPKPSKGTSSKTAKPVGKPVAKAAVKPAPKLAPTKNKKTAPQAKNKPQIRAEGRVAITKPIQPTAKAAHKTPSPKALKTSSTKPSPKPQKGKPAPRATTPVAPKRVAASKVAVKAAKTAPQKGLSAPQTKQPASSPKVAASPTSKQKETKQKGGTVSRTATPPASPKQALKAAAQIKPPTKEPSKVTTKTKAPEPVKPSKTKGASIPAPQLVIVSKTTHKQSKSEGAKTKQGKGKNESSSSSAPAASNPLAAEFDMADKLRELIRLAKEQGYLTFDDLNEALPDTVSDPEEMEIILTRLNGMEIQVIEASDVDRFKDGKKDAEEDEEDKTADQRADILDDPVRMYLKQMGQVPLLTREQEVEISKRIEDAELNVLKHINRYGFVSKLYTDLASKLLEGKERFDRVIQDKKIESRDSYMKLLPKLISTLSEAGDEASQLYQRFLKTGESEASSKLYPDFKKSHAAIQKQYSKFFFKQKVTEEFVQLAEEAAKLVNRLRDESLSGKKRSNPTPTRTTNRLLDEYGRVPRRLPGTAPLDAQSTPRQNRNGRGKLALGHLYRQKVHEPWPLFPRSHSGRQHGANEGRRKIRVSSRLQVLHLRHLVDPSGHHALHRRPSAYDPHSGPHDRDDQQADAGAEAVSARLWPRTHARGSRRGN